MILDVLNARLILVALICSSPAILLLDGPILRGLVAGLAAAGIGIVGRTIRTGETEFLVSIIAPLVAIVATPAVWMLVQALPLNVMAHPIWSSAEAALGRPMAGSISIDPGQTVSALGQYLSVVAIGLLSAAVSVQRERAEWVLFSLVGASALMGVILITHDVFGLTFLGAGAASERSQVVDCTAIGAIIALAGCIRTIERFETRKASPDRSVPFLTLTLAGCVVTLALCVAALMLGATAGVILAAAYGLVALASTSAIRRLGLGPWGITGIAVTAVGVAVLIVAAQPRLNANSLPLAFAAGTPAPFMADSQRILDESPALGMGAGTFSSIAPIYGAGDGTSVRAAPTLAATLAIEMGGFMWWLIAAAMIAAALGLLRASLLRGRDSFYAAAGGGCLLTFLLLSFVNAGLLGTGATLTTAAAIGLALAQSKSRKVQ